MAILTQEEQEAVDFFKRGGPEEEYKIRVQYFTLPPDRSLGGPASLHQTLVAEAAREMAAIEDKKLTDMITKYGLKF